MREKTRPGNVVGGGPSGLGDLFPSAGGGSATVASGPYAEQLPVDGMSVGEIRRRYRDRFDIDPRSQAVLDGQPVGDETRLRAGQVLTFVHRAGEKGCDDMEMLQMIMPGAGEGALRPAGLNARAAQEVVFEGKVARASSPEGQTATMSIEELLERLDGGGMNTGGVVLPDGVKAVLKRGSVTIWVHQTPPRLHRFKWIAADSARAFGEGTSYREVTIALPYLIVLAVFLQGRDNRLHLSGHNECFFRNEPLSDVSDRLFFPALLNCSKFAQPRGNPLAWICTQHLSRAGHARVKDDNRRMRAAFKALMHCLLETGFNRSSEENEGSSWFTESRVVDDRVSTIEKWDAASRDDPMFVLEVPWLDTGLSVREVADRIAGNLRAGRAVPRSAADIARQLFNHGTIGS